MKSFLFYLAFTFLVISLIFGQQQINRRLELAVQLKALAEDCAEAGALVCDENYMIDEARARANARALLEKCVQAYGRNISEFELDIELPTARSCKATVYFRTLKIERSSVYEWVLTEYNY